MDDSDRCPRCGAELVGGSTPAGLCVGCLLQTGLEIADDLESLPALPAVPGYRLLRALGEGGMGTVYLAEELELGRQVALKLISTSTRRHEARARFLREARTMAAVEHPHIVRLYRLGRSEDGRDFLAMEYVEGETLAERIEQRGRLPLGQAFSLARQTVEALAAAWERQVVHRDIKPSNLFVDARDQLRVGDFGLARPSTLGADQKLTHDGALLGTPAYLSPEQARGESADFRSDIYSLGIVLFEMLAGEPPFSAANPLDLVYQQLHRALPLLQIEGRPVALEVQQLLASMTAKDRELRPASYLELLARLDAVLDRLDADATPTQTLVPALPPASTHLPMGPLVAKRCDRLRQMMAFAQHFRENRTRHPGRPFVYLVPGEEGQGHDSLVERFVHEHVSHSLEADSRSGGGVLRRWIGWPGGASPSELRSYLVTDLFSDLDPSYTGIDASARPLVELERISMASAVILQHEIRTGKLDRAGVQLIDWYVNRFWSEVPVSPDTPQFLVFLNLIYSRPHPRDLWRSLLSPSPLRRRTLGSRLQSIFEDRAGGVPRLLLGELDSVTLDHVKEWFSLHQVYETEKERRQAAETLFTTERGTAIDSLPMDEVEFSLARIHSEFLRRKGLYP